MDDAVTGRGNRLATWIVAAAWGASVLLVLMVAPAMAQEGPALAVLGGALLDGSGGPPVAPSLVVARDGIITYAGPEDRSRIPDGARIIDATDMAVLPGFIDAHTHVTTFEGFTPDQARRACLLAGVTCVGDAGSSLAAMAELARDPEGGNSAEPLCRVVFSGPVLAAPGGYPAPMHGEEFCLFAATPDEAETGVALLHERGATLLKLAFDAGRSGNWPLMDPAAARAAIEAAHQRSMVVRAHVEDLDGLAPALDAGADVIEHLPHRASAALPRGPFSDPGWRPLPEYADLLSRMADGRIMAAPTLSIEALAHWRMDGPLQAVALFSAAGGRVALASDASFDRLAPGLPLGEFELLLAAGLSLQEVVTAATRNAALACGRDDLGLLAPGMAADMVLVPADFLAASEDSGQALLESLADVQWVIKAGAVVRSP